MTPHIFPFFFFNATATTAIYTLSLHDALPISPPAAFSCRSVAACLSLRLCGAFRSDQRASLNRRARSEEHTSELQSQSNLVCRLLLEKKKTCKMDPLKKTALDMSALYLLTILW